ncbi:hypothetical protein ACNVED_07655 [Legionella sp. D16C41]|uniref:hypothetical protein n=1 Tax=Legionella sp. D16C41 TaxID=3402688 RepID=UPI003AF8B8C1
MKSSDAKTEPKIKFEDTAAQVLLKEKKLNKIKEIEKKIVFFSTLTRKMQENPTQANLDALKADDEEINNFYSGM